jgi:hypothetical protein
MQEMPQESASQKILDLLQTRKVVIDREFVILPDGDEPLFFLWENRQKTDRLKRYNRS